MGNMSRLVTYAFALLFLFSGTKATSAELFQRRGFTMTEIGNHLYDANEGIGPKTEAQIILDRLHQLGVRHLVLSPRALMHHPRQSYVLPVPAPTDQPPERDRYLRFIRYAQQMGMTVGIRPTVFVVDAFGGTPFVETLPSGEQRVWWHGNIQPSNPQEWFQSFAFYLEPYLEIARVAGVTEFTIGAELESLTVGAGSAWMEHPYGFPENWLALLRFARERVNPTTTLMYDMNFADDLVALGGQMVPGGELALWRQRIAYSQPLTEVEVAAKTALTEFWTTLDAIGIDMYRSLARPDEILPTDYEGLVRMLSARTDNLVGELEQTVADLDGATGKTAALVMKEIGFKSVDRGFVDPFLYAGSGTFNEMHQAAAYEAVFRSFSSRPLSWFAGIVFWDASVDLNLHGPFDRGFSPLGKMMSEDVVRRFWGQR